MESFYCEIKQSNKCKEELDYSKGEVFHCSLLMENGKINNHVHSCYHCFLELYGEFKAIKKTSK